MIFKPHKVNPVVIDSDQEGITDRPILQTETNEEPTKIEAKKAGKEQYKFQTSYRKANWCQKFFYMYANPVVDAVYSNGGKLSMVDIEDIKVDDGETRRLV